MKKIQDEKKIYLKDLLFAALYQWKRILVVAVLAALVLGGLKGISGWKALKTPNTSQQAASEQYAHDKDVIDQKLALLQISIDNQREYLENSVLMLLDPQGYYNAALSLYAKTDFQIIPDSSYQNPDRTDTVLNAYSAVINGRDCVDAIAEAMQIQRQYASELITVEVSTITDTVQISVKSLTEDGAKAALDVLVQSIQSAHDRIEQAVTAHSVSILEQSVTQKVDLTLADLQKNENKRLTDLQASVVAAQAELAALTPPVVQSTTRSAVVKDVLIFAILGGVIGAFVTMCVAWVEYIASDKVYSARTLHDRTGLKVISCVSEGADNGIDRWLQKLEGRNMIRQDAQLAILAVDIRCRMDDAKHLLVLGTADTQAVASALSHQLPNAQVDSGNILDSAAALGALKACDAVVIAEKCGTSRYSAVNREAELVSDYHKPILGCVLFGG